MLLTGQVQNLGLPRASAYALARTFCRKRHITIAARYSIVFGISSSSSSSSCKALFCLEFKSSAKGTSISALQNIKAKR